MEVGFLLLSILEHRAGIEPAYTGFADLRVSHFATGALPRGCKEQGSSAFASRAITVRASTQGDQDSRRVPVSSALFSRQLFSG
jgi:hypothetical protein